MAKISKTSGQSITRGSYQTARQLRLGGSGASEQTKPMPLLRATPGTGGGGVASGKREYHKAGDSSGFNVAYSEREMANPNLGSLLNVGKSKPPKARKGFV